MLVDSNNNNKYYIKPQKLTTVNKCSEMKNKTKYRYCPQPNTFVLGNNEPNINIQKQTTMSYDLYHITIVRYKCPVSLSRRV